MSPSLAFIVGFAAAPALFVLARMWRNIPTPAMGASIGPVGISHTDRDCTFRGWGTAREPGILAIGGPRTRVVFMSRHVRRQLGAGIVVVKLGKLRFKVGVPKIAGA